MSLKISLDKKEYKGPDDSILIYQVPSKPKIVALFMLANINGKPDPAIFNPKKVDATKQLEYNYQIAEAYIVGWKNVVGEDGKNIEFKKEYVEYLDMVTIAEFVIEVVFPTMMDSLGIKEKEEKDKEEDEEEKDPLAT